LYSLPTFSLKGPITASRFLSTISRQSNNTIRRLALHWMAQDIGEEVPAWKEAWKHIRAMPNLRSIHVALYDYYPGYLEGQLLAPLMKCKVKVFVVDLPRHVKKGRSMWIHRFVL
jgi:hypothetical protein